MPETFQFRGSSNLASAEYDLSAVGGEADDLQITFQSGATYIYHGVPQAVYQGLITAASAGSYFYKNIRDRFDFEEA